MTWKQKAEIQNHRRVIGTPCSEVAAIYGIPVKRVYTICCEPPAAEQEYARVTGRKAAEHWDNFIKWLDASI